MNTLAKVMPNSRPQPWRARRKPGVAWVAGLFLAAGVCLASAAQDQLILGVEQVPKDGLVLARVDLTEAARACGVTVNPERLRAFSGEDAVPIQFVPDPGSPTAGTVVLACRPGSTSAQVRLDFSGPAMAVAKPAATRVRSREFTAVHDPQRLGGFPSEIRFASSGRKFDAFHWGDRLYDRQDGAFSLAQDPNPQVQCVSTGPLCTVVRVAARYTRADGLRPASEPEAVYDWFYFLDPPLVYVRCVATQREPRPWREAHFLELGFPTNAFPQWTGGEPAKTGAFAGNEASHRFNRWAAILEGDHGIGLFAAGPVGIYDGRAYGRYLHADMEAAWREWATTRFERSAWLWIGAAEKPAETLAALAAVHSAAPVLRVTTRRLQERLELVQARFVRANGAARRTLGWDLGRLRLLEKQGRFREALAGASGRLPKDWSVLPAGDLRLVLERRPGGLAVLDLLDAATGRLLAGADRQPLFALTLHDATTNELQLTSDQGWQHVSLEKGPEANSFALRWSRPQARQLGPLSVVAHVRLDAARHRLAWRLAAEGQAQPWSLWQVRFPQLTLSAAGADSQLLLPQAAGLLKPVGREPLNRFHGDYPSGWMVMQLSALWDPAAGTGLYFALHDPLGSTKQFSAESPGPGRPVRLAWDIPVPNMGRPGNRFDLPGEAVWQVLRGDWFDAAVIYRDWVRHEAKWFPALGPDGRTDSPPWLRELCVWAQTGGGTNDCVEPVLEFARALGRPLGFHWYNWHQIPFDNDYPHYFPTKPGFADGVRQLQQANVFVMPYINGRLWDTLDGGTNDIEFSSLARPAATKDPQGQPRAETYGSKEADGRPVRLAVMCPATPLWQARQHDLVLRLFQQCGVQGVYMDQVAAAKPELCFDPAHGHPLGGGSWWNDQGYWPLLEQIRRDKAPDRILTTECNAEPFLRWFDGYLTWHWQYDGQVPLFPAVYGGAIQMFGRAYRGGPTKDLALRMKAAQQLVWGEQLGWLDPRLTHEPDNFKFFRNAVELRWQLRRFFYAGEMARPPHLAGAIPNVTADWQWSGPWPVTTPAVLSGAWQLPAEHRLVLLFANVSDQPLSATVEYDLREAGLAGATFSRRQQAPGAASPLTPVPAALREPITLPPRSLVAWVLGGPE